MNAPAPESEAPSLPAPPSPSLTDFQLAEWKRRQDLVRSCLAAGVGEPGGTSLRRIAQATGEPIANLSRYLAAFRALGADGLRPEVGTGRPAKFDLTRDEELALRAHNLERGSFALAVEWFARDPRCRPATRAAILETLDNAARDRREARWPQSLRRAGYVTAEERACFRGRKASADLELCARRGLFYVDEIGVERELVAGALWESDDMSSNEPFRYADPDGGATRVGRQMLATVDVFSSAYLGVTPIGRERDAYRVEDIADHLRELVVAHGLPLAWRIERGVWENIFIDGLELENGEVWGGLDVLFSVVRTWKSRGKGTIETSFNLLQNLIAHTSTSIGRERGEFEQGTKLFLRAQKGDPVAAAHFWDIAQAADGYRAAMEIFNTRPKKRRAHGRDLVVPADQFRGAMRRDCPEGELWRFCPVKRRATVRQGAIEMMVAHYPMPFRFQVNGITDGLFLEHGYQVLVAFHPGRPEEGCHVFNAETGTRNRDGHRFAAPLLVAPLSEDSPQFSLSKIEQDAFAARRKAAAAVRSEFRAIMPAGRSGARVSTARDGRGNAAEVRRDTGYQSADGVTGAPLQPGRTSRTSGPVPGGPSRRPEVDYDLEAVRVAAMEAEAAPEFLP